MTDNSLNKNTAFASLPLQAELLTNLDALGYSDMTPIQAQSLPEIVAGRDVLAQAKTGSGKTAAFALGVLHKLDVSALDRKSTRLNSSHVAISYAVFFLKKKRII